MANCDPAVPAAGKASALKLNPTSPGKRDSGGTAALYAGINSPVGQALLPVRFIFRDGEIQTVEQASLSAEEVALAQ
jgi:hypothetical protein